MKDDSQLLAHARLHFHVAHSAFEENYHEGYDEGLMDIPESANPYPEGSQEHAFWHDGWWAAFYGEEPLFDLDGNVAAEPLTATPIGCLTERNTFWERFGEIIFVLFFGGLIAAVCVDIAT